MPTIIFRVTSDRIHDMNIEPGKTLKQLTDQLSCAGYDVAEAEVNIVHPTYSRVGGNTAAYEFKGGECVEFDTETLDLPTLNKDLIDEETQILRDKAAADLERMEARQAAADHEDHDGCDSAAAVKDAEKAAASASYLVKTV